MSRINRDDVDKLYDYDLYIPKRIIYVGSVSINEEIESGVDAHMAERVVKGIHLLEQSEGPITVIMNNPGGDWFHGMAIYDAIKTAKNHVTIKAYGHAMSMGAVILQAADERVLSPNSKVMIHYGYMGMGYTHTKIFEKWAEESKRVSKEMEDILLEKIQQKHPEFKRKKLVEMLNFDTILTAKEAVDLGLADKILGED